jgi:phage-related protein
MAVTNLDPADIAALAQAISDAINKARAEAKAKAEADYAKKPPLPVQAAEGVRKSTGIDAISSITGFFEKLTALAAPIEKLVQGMNPALVEHMQLVFDDLFAVLGQAVEPVLEAMIPVFRMFADVIAQFVPLIIPLTKAMGEYFAALGGAMVEVLQPLLPILAVVLVPLTYAFRILAVVMKAIGEAIGWVVKQILAMVNAIRRAFGLDEINLDKTKGSTGAAVKPAQYGSIADIGSRSSQAAFSMGISGAKSTEEQMLDKLGELVEVSRDIKANTADKKSAGGAGGVFGGDGKIRPDIVTPKVKPPRDQVIPPTGSGIGGFGH